MKFLIFTRTDWREAPRARHQLAQSLSLNYQVIFIESNKLGLPNLKISNVNSNLKIYSPKWILPSKIRFRLPIFNELYQYWILKKLNIDYREYILIIFDHTGHKLIKAPFQKKIYYCNDEHINGSSLSIRPLKSYFRFSEKKIAKKSDLCIATANSLRDKLKILNPNTHIIKLGAPTITIPLYYKSYFQGRKKVGFVGFIGGNTDIDVFFNILKHSNYELHVWGYIAKSKLQMLSRFAEFHFHGVKTGSELYKGLNNCHVGISPYIFSKKTSGITPNKLWLYLALGLPVVVTKVLNIKDWDFPRGFIYKTEQNENFNNLIDLAIKENNEYNFYKRIEFSKLNSWNQRTNVLLELINNI